MRRTLVLLVPLALFAALALLFLKQLREGGDPSIVPSALIGQKAPAISLRPLGGGAADRVTLDDPDFAGQVRIVNFWASWCAPCREEHPLLTRLAGDNRVRLIGINYKDQAANAERFLARLGNPFAAIGVDSAGRTGIDWGVYGLPETFIVGADGTIRHKIIGPLSEAQMSGDFGKALEAAIAATATE